MNNSSFEQLQEEREYHGVFIHYYIIKQPAGALEEQSVG